METWRRETSTFFYNLKKKTETKNFDNRNWLRTIASEIYQLYKFRYGRAREPNWSTSVIISDIGVKWINVKFERIHTADSRHYTHCIHSYENFGSYIIWD